MTSAPTTQVDIGMLIRKPIAEVFEAFVNPDTITKFWFDRSTGRLEEGAQVSWHWQCFGVSSNARVLAFEKNKHIKFEWSSDDNPATILEWSFEERSDDTTYVSVVHYGFNAGEGDVAEQAIDSSGGFGMVLVSAKAYLEHGVQLSITEDRF